MDGKENVAMKYNYKLDESLGEQINVNDLKRRHRQLQAKLHALSSPTELQSFEATYKLKSSSQQKTVSSKPVPPTTIRTPLSKTTTAVRPAGSALKSALAKPSSQSTPSTPVTNKAVAHAQISQVSTKHVTKHQNRATATLAALPPGTSLSAIIPSFGTPRTPAENSIVSDNYRATQKFATASERRAALVAESQKQRNNSKALQLTKSATSTGMNPTTSKKGLVSTKGSVSAPSSLVRGVPAMPNVAKTARLTSKNLTAALSMLSQESNSDKPLPPNETTSELSDESKRSIRAVPVAVPPAFKKAPAGFGRSAASTATDKTPNAIIPSGDGISLLHPNKIDLDVKSEVSDESNRSIRANSAAIPPAYKKAPAGFGRSVTPTPSAEGIALMDTNNRNDKKIGGLSSTITSTKSEDFPRPVSRPKAAMTTPSRPPPPSTEKMPRSQSAKKAPASASKVPLNTQSNKPVSNTTITPSSSSNKSDKMPLNAAKLFALVSTAPPTKKEAPPSVASANGRRPSSFKVSKQAASETSSANGRLSGGSLPSSPLKPRFTTSTRSTPSSPHTSARSDISENNRRETKKLSPKRVAENPFQMLVKS